MLLGLGAEHLTVGIACVLGYGMRLLPISGGGSFSADCDGVDLGPFDLADSVRYAHGHLDSIVPMLSEK